MEKNSKIYVAGHTGLAGSALVKVLQTQGYNNLIFKTHKELDLLNQWAVADFFTLEKPEYVFLAAAKVGGILANKLKPAEFIYDNLQIEINIIHQSYLHGVKKLLFLCSSCVYPRECPQPIKEEYLLTGLLEPNNEPYALAKIAGLKMCQSYNRQYGTNFIAAMPTNLYGENDNFNPQDSHLFPALTKKFCEAKKNNAKNVSIWGTGTPCREFLYASDMADGCIFLMNNFNPTKKQNDKGEIFFNLGTGSDLTIKELVKIFKEITGFTGKINWDATKPDGMAQKLQDMSKMHSFGWKHKVELKDGVKMMCNLYLKNLN